MRSKKKLITVLCIVLAGLIVLEGLLAVVIYISSVGSKGFVAANSDAFADSRLVMRDGIQVPEDSKDVQKRFSRLENENGVYTLVYRKELPEFFASLSEGELFCITPESGADESFFAYGFSGKVISKSSDGNEAKISFAVPDITELFSDLDISLSAPETEVESIQFIPEGSESIDDCLFATDEVSGGPALMSVSPALAAIKLNEVDADFDIKEGNKTSLLSDYAYICEELEIDTETDITVENFDLAVNSNVILEDLAIKSDIAYHTDATTGQVVIDSYDIGMISKHIMETKVEASVSAGLDDIGGGLSIIDFKDATDAEEGKIVLGTFLIGLSAPFLESDTNKVSYISLGLAVQLSLTAWGEISVECTYEQSGYARIEADSAGKVIEEVRGYDYPNPVVSAASPTEEQINSMPTINCQAAGEINFHAGLGIDAGLCILGTVPLKISNNIIDLQYSRRMLILDEAFNMDDEATVYDNGYLLDENTELFKVSITSFLRLNIGFESDLDVLNMTSFDIGAECQLLNKVIYQYPDPVGFSHSQCSFGGIQIGDSYTDSALRDTFKEFQKDTDQYNIIGSIKDDAVDSAVNGMINGLDLELGSLAEDLGVNFEGYDLAVFSAGALYFMDSTGRVVGAILTGETIMNVSGFACGQSKVKTEILYSVPQNQMSTHIDLGEYFEQATGIKESDLTVYTYNSTDSQEKMELLYSDDELKLIIVYDQSLMNMYG